jgi:protease PrsW
VAADSTLDRLLAGSPLRRPRVARRVLFGLVAALLASVAVIFAAVGGLGNPEAVRAFLLGLLVSALLSVVPVLILRYLDRRERESPWLFVALRRSGKWERHVIEQELADEVGGAVTPEEYDAIRHDHVLTPGASITSIAGSPPPW